MAEKDILSAKQEQAITALLTAGTVRSAAKYAGMSERTLYRWMQDESFRERLKQAQADAIEATVRQLADAASVAVVVLRTLVVSNEASATARVRAADVILGKAILFREIGEHEERLKAIEQWIAERAKANEN